MATSVTKITGKMMLLRYFSILPMISLMVGFFLGFALYSCHFFCFKNIDNTSHIVTLDEPNKNHPLIFIGGIPRSGTTLVRVMLDAHKDIRCGQETHVIPYFIKKLRSHGPLEYQRMQLAGITKDVLNKAASRFILEIITKHGKRAKRLCNKDPFTLLFSSYLHTLFPNSKFILLIRDGRAVIHSIISKGVIISRWNLTDHVDCLKRWNKKVKTMNDQCLKLGDKVCMRLFYEQLILHPKQQMERVLSFLNIPWSEDIFNYYKIVNKPDGILVSPFEVSSTQVMMPINLESLTAWVGFFPQDILDQMDNIAPMLKTLGYDPNANPPKYGIPDSFVNKNTKLIEENIDIYETRQEEFHNKMLELMGDLEIKDEIIQYTNNYTNMD